MAAESGGVEPGRVYLDYAGFAPVDSRVLAVMRPFLEAGIGNPSARHSLGAEARESLDAARVKGARLCGGAPGGLVFPSGAPEANNLAIKGVVARARSGGSARVLLPAIEHISLLNACRHLPKPAVTVCYLPVDGAAPAAPPHGPHGGSTRRPRESRERHRAAAQGDGSRHPRGGRGAARGR